MLDGYWLGLLGGVIVLGLSIELVRRRQVRGRFAIAWVLLGGVGVSLAVFPSALVWLTTLLHVKVPLNLVLFGGVLFLLVISMQLASEVGRLEARTRRLAEEVAILSSRHSTQGVGQGEPGSDGA